MTLHHVPGTKSAPGVYIVHRVSSRVTSLRFFSAGERLAEQFHRTMLHLTKQPIVLEEVTG